MLFDTLQFSMRCLRCTKILKSRDIRTSMTGRCMSAWVHRVPSGIIDEEIVLDKAEPAQRPRKFVNEDEEHRPMKPRPSKLVYKKPAPIARIDQTYKDDGTLNFVRLAENDRKLSSLMLTLKSRKMRSMNRQILLEGHRLITDALKAGINPEIILFTRPPTVERLPLPANGVQLYRVPYKTIRLWSDLTTAPGIIGVFTLPESFEKEPADDSIPLTIICDNVRDPGNLGSILRAAAGVGCERIILTKGCVDIWETKVLRSAAGAHFRISISKSVEWDEIESLISPIAKIFIADHDRNVTSNSSAESSVSPDSPNDGTVDSDSPDDGIVSSNSSSDKVTAGLEVESTSKISSNNDDYDDYDDDDDDDDRERKINKMAERKRSQGEARAAAEALHVKIRELADRLPIVPYYGVDYTTNQVVLIVGGETEGLSYESIQLTSERGGARVNIPLTNEVDSLNTGMALGIVAFEVKRQFANRSNAIFK